MTDTPTFFSTPAKFGAWLKKHHATATELLVGFYTTSSGKPSMTWPESGAEALCCGWIDGIRRNRDAESYTIRFTPRKPKSNWSAVNVALAQQLIADRRMQPAGLTAFQRRPEHPGYSYEQRKGLTLSPAQLKQFRSHRQAHAYFEAQAPSYRQACVHWILSAKQEATSQRRLDLLITCSSEGRRIPAFLERKAPK